MKSTLSGQDALAPHPVSSPRLWDAVDLARDATGGTISYVAELPPPPLHPGRDIETEGRYEVSPALKHIFDAQTVAGIKAEFEELLAREESK